MSIFNFHRNKVKPAKPKPPSSPMSNQSGQPILIAQNVNPIGMAYWRNINNHKDSNVLKVFLSKDDELILLTINKDSLQVQSEVRLGIHHTGEGCYFSAINPEILYTPLSNKLIQFNINNGNQQAVWESEYYLWQCHSSYDESVHSATLKNGNWDVIGWGLSHGDKYDIHGVPDECQIDKSGNWLVIKEDNLNRIIYVPTGSERIIQNEEGALGHSDCGFECMMGENDFSSSAGALDLFHLRTGERRLIYSTGIWNMGYVSFTNARPGPVDDQNCLITSPNELILVNIGSGQGRVVCPNLAESQETYEKRPKANLCPLGEFAVWTAWVNGQMNAYLVKI